MLGNLFRKFVKITVSSPIPLESHQKINKDRAAYLAKILKAFSEGKTIQQYPLRHGDKYRDIHFEDEFEHIYNSYGPYVFRIKPYPVYRPFQCGKEFSLVATVNGKFVKDQEGKEYEVLNAKEDRIELKEKGNVSFETLLKEYKFLNDAVCGMIGYFAES